MTQLPLMFLSTIRNMVKIKVILWYLS